MAKPFIIGLGHYSRTGKDTAADFIVKYLHDEGFAVKKISWAWKLKDICYQLYKWAGVQQPEWYDTPEGEKARDVVLPAIDMTPVQLWVAFGTPAVRENVYEDTWVDYVLHAHPEWDFLVIPDTRFMNEIDTVQQSGGVAVKVIRPGVQPRPTVADRALAKFNRWDFLINNSSNLHDLKVKSYRLAEYFIECRKGRNAEQREHEPHRLEGLRSGTADGSVASVHRGDQESGPHQGDPRNSPR